MVSFNGDLHVDNKDSKKVSKTRKIFLYLIKNNIGINVSHNSDKIIFMNIIFIFYSQKKTRNK